MRLPPFGCPEYGFRRSPTLPGPIHDDDEWSWLPFLSQLGIYATDCSKLGLILNIVGCDISDPKDGVI